MKTIIFFGTSQFSAHILAELIKSEKFQIEAVVTSPDKPVGRKQEVTASPVALTSQKSHIACLKPIKLDSSFLTTNSQLLDSDLFVVAAYGKILPETLLKIPKLASVNVHGSLLPKYRGASPIQQAILNGDKKTGITIMMMEKQVDHGDILSQAEISISQNDTFETLSSKMAQTGDKLLIKTLQDFIEGKISPHKQNHAQASYTKLITKQDGYFDIDSPPDKKKLDRMIRAYYPWPNVWTKYKGKIVKFYPGNKLQMEGKKVTAQSEFLKGYPGFPEVF